MTIKNFEHHQPNIATSSYIDPSAVVIGQVKIADGASIWPQVVLRGDINHINIGEKTNIQDNSVCHVTHAGPFNPDGFALSIGNHVTVGHRAMLHGCQIQDYCLIGMGAIVMDGAHVESDVYVAAGSLVPSGKRLTTGYLWMGSPVKRIRALTQEELDYIRYSAEYYYKLSQRYI